MNIGLSNLAFDNSDIELLKYLPKIGINNIEIVYTKHNSWDSNIDNTLDVFKYFSNLNLNINSIQSIFYNTNINSFSQINEIKNHLKRLFNICNKLKIKRIVFGSPSFRKSYIENKNYIIEVFDFIENELQNSNIKFLIEPNSRIYNTEYFYNPYEIFDFIKKNNYKNISSMIDTHNLLLENYDPIKILKENIDMIEHIHVSEHGLSSLTNIDFHYEFSESLKNTNYNGLIIFEIIKNNNILENIIEFSRIYQSI